MSRIGLVAVLCLREIVKVRLTDHSRTVALIAGLTVLAPLLTIDRPTASPMAKRTTSQLHATDRSIWPVQKASERATDLQDDLVFPGLLKLKDLEAGNPLATYAAMLDLEPQYRRSKIFAAVYPEIRYNFEEFLGFPFAGVQAMSLPVFRGNAVREERAIPESYKAENALTVIEREAKKTRLVIWGEEHHLPQTRSLYDSLLRVLWKQGYRYLAAETFGDAVMDNSFKFPDHHTGYYTHDPVFAAAVRTAKELGFKLIAYDTNERGPSGDSSFRDRTQAQNLKSRIFDLDPEAKAIIIAGRGHASEKPAAGGWTPMASVLKQLTGIDPLTIYAPRMSQRSRPEEEDPLYRYAESHGLIKRPTIFRNKANGALLGSEGGDLDAYIFWPRIKLTRGRPDWMIRELGRRPIAIPRALFRGRGMRLVQVFKIGEPGSAIPVDQVIIDEQSNKKVLMLPNGKFWARTIDRESRVLAKASLNAR